MARITRFSPAWHDHDRTWPLSRLHQEMNRLFTDTFRGLDENQGDGNGWNFNPVVDVERDDRQYEITVELPGVTMTDVDVEVSGETLTISGTKERKRTTGEGNSQRSERVYGSFQRTFQLPDDADKEKISARFSDGVLTVCVPRDEEAGRRSSRRIEIEAAASQDPEPRESQEDRQRHPAQESREPHPGRAEDRKPGYQ